MSNSDDDFKDLPDLSYTPISSIKSSTKQKFKPPTSKNRNTVKKPFFKLQNNELISFKVKDAYFLILYLVISYFRVLGLRKLKQILIKFQNLFAKQPMKVLLLSRPSTALWK